MVKDTTDLKAIGYYTGKIVIGIGLLMLIPILVSLISREWNTVLDFLIGLAICVSTGLLLILVSTPCKNKLTWTQGMVVAALSWVVSMMLAAIPYWLSGHWLSYLDTLFDVMSGFTTTGLVLIQDLDHVSDGINTWRHLLSYLGGQGIIVLALIFMARTMSGAFTLYVGEAKDVKLLPNVVNTARAIWIISLVYLAMGTGILWAVGIFIGMPPYRALLHGMWVFMAAWSTGGFAPMSQNILYYHSFTYELITIVIFIIGSFNFALHYSIWTGNRREIFKNIETVSFFITSTILIALATFELGRMKIYPDAVSLFRKGYYQMISGHTTTGFMTIYARQFINEWGDLATLALIVAMLIGGSASSTAGGFKGLRVGIAFKAIVQDIKRLMRPGTAITVEKFHFIREQTLESDYTKSALLVILMYIFIFTIGVMVPIFYGYPLLDSVFESASVTGNVGLTAGLTSASMPAAIKVLYIFMMWVGRLEFMSVLVLFGYAAREVKRLCTGR